ncbi:MAG TPA: hypothetical protein VGS41_19100, partial [Chthonomonadales bacterium]|nr:hypothetical protein [Chthonomonadales bacterium]
MSGAGGLPGDANAINDSGQVAGTREYTKLVNSCQKRFPLATLWTPTSPHGLTGSWIDLGSAGYSS